MPEIQYSSSRYISFSPAYFNVLKSTHNPLGKVSYVFRRGFPHIYMLICPENAPKYNKDNDTQDEIMILLTHYLFNQSKTSRTD